MGYTTGRKPWRSEPWRREEYNTDVESNFAVKQKMYFFGLAIFFLFGILGLQLARMQLVNGNKYEARAETNRLREVPILPVRGLIYDRNGEALVENQASFAAAVVAADVPDINLSSSPPSCPDRCQEISISLQEMTGVPAAKIEETILARAASNDPFTPAVVKSDMPQDKAFMLREQLPNLPGVRVVVEPKRFYTQGALVSHVLGFVGPIDQADYEKLSKSGYELNDRIGKTGIESTYENILRGVAGERQVETDASGRDIRVIDEKPATPGSNVVLSLDLDLQRHVEQFVKEGLGASKNAAAIVMDVHTGEILSLVSWPTYDNNIFTGEVDEAALAQLLNDPGKPLLNHAITEQYAPGSTFKQITGLAALQEGIATANTEITSLGVLYVENEFDPSIKYPFKDWAALGTLNFTRGVAMSSDVYFYYLSGGYVQNGRTVFQGLGPTKLAEWARRFGLGEPTGIDLPGEVDGIVPDPKWKEETIGDTWFVGDTYNMGIGQGYVAATPIQMILVAAAVANGGDILVPHLVKEVRTATGDVIKAKTNNVKRNLNIDPRNIALMREGMREAVADGSATTGRSSVVQLAGKTGTAEFGEQRPDGTYQEHGWFTGFAPFENPEIAVCVFLETGGGALSAAPVASKIVSYYFQRKNSAQGATTTP
jgi:penicillin-binding protein 2